MLRLRGSAAAYVGMAFVVACASAPSGGAARERIEPPHMTSRGVFPQLRLSSGIAATGAPIHLTIEVRIDSTGTPDMSTFRAVGSVAAANRDALYEWIRSSTFSPARRNGQPLSGWYRTTADIRVSK